MAAPSVLSEITFRDSGISISQKYASTGAKVATWAAVTWILLGFESIIRPEQENYRDALWMVPFALTAVAFTFLHLAKRDRSSRFESASYYFLMIASGLVFLGNVGVLAEQPMLAKFAFPWGAILWMIGLIAFGIATLKGKALPRYVGASIILLEPGSLITGLALAPIAPLHERGAYSAGIEKGLVLALVAWALYGLSRRKFEPVPVALSR